jgi:hypothetical protein
MTDTPDRRQDDATTGADRAVDLNGEDSAAILTRYAARLTMAQEPLRALAAMKPLGTA